MLIEEAEQNNYIFQTYTDIELDKLIQLKSCKSQQSFLEQLNIILQINCNSKINLTNLKSVLTQEFINIAIPVMVNSSLNLLKYPPKIKLITQPGKHQFKCEIIFGFLSLAFFNLLIKQYKNVFPKRINYNELFSNQKHSQIQKEKLKGHLHYFIQFSINNRNDIITIERLSFNKKYHREKFSVQNILNLNQTLWQNSQCPLSSIELNPKSIESIENCVIVDFADKLFGGFTFYNNVAQEEIMLLCKPESLIAIFLTSELKSEDCLLIQNCLDYNGYTGYRNTFQLKKLNPINKQQVILAMDAFNYRYKPNSQYSMEMILRDLNKSFIGFSQSSDVCVQPISTGNWGCGIFRGDWMLKLIIQWIAYSQSLTNINNKLINQSNLFYSLYDKPNIRQKLIQINDKYDTVGKLFEALTKYPHSQNYQQITILDFLLQK